MWQISYGVRVIIKYIIWKEPEEITYLTLKISVVIRDFIYYEKLNSCLL